MNETGHNRLGRRRAAVVTSLAGIGAASLAACSSGGSSGSTSASPSGHVSITVGCEPSKTQAAQRSFFVQDIKLFEKANPNITVTGVDTNPGEDPSTFDATRSTCHAPSVFYK